MTDSWIYLGDGVYGKWDGYHVVLMSGTPTHQQHVIHLDHHVRAALMNLFKNIGESTVGGGER